VTETDLKQALDRLALEGRSVDFWLRDDDATQPTAALDRLTDLCAKFSVPLLLAVIPEPTDEKLAAHLDGLEKAVIEVAVHGWAHANHAGPQEKKQELGSHRPLTEVTDELAAGFAKLAELHASRFVPMLVPPWNRIAAPVIDALPELGFRSLSTFGPKKPAPVAVLNSDVDIIDWHGTRGGRPSTDLFGEILALLDNGQERPAIGILGHHLVHDTQAWDFLTSLFRITAGHPACHWRSVSDLLRH
jgi:peptidoglycan/xylan/chitin deacetylase (PgdA/CDA1 family)